VVRKDWRRGKAAGGKRGLHQQRRVWTMGGQKSSGGGKRWVGQMPRERKGNHKKRGTTTESFAGGTAGRVWGGAADKGGTGCAKKREKSPTGYQEKGRRLEKSVESGRNPEGETRSGDVAEKAM